MSSRHTPTTHDVREAWLTAEYEERDPAFTSDDDIRGEFNRWLAAHDAEVREEANWIIARIVSAANKGPLEGEDGFILGYQMSVGPIHAAIPFLQKQGIVVTTTGEIRGLEITETEAGRIAERTIEAINSAGGLSQHIENLERKATPWVPVKQEGPEPIASHEGHRILESPTVSSLSTGVIPRTCTTCDVELEPREERRG